MAAPSRVAVPAHRPGPARRPLDAICDRILAELRTSPEAVKDIFIKPEETVGALRPPSRNLTRRERELRRFLSPQDDERLMREREALQKRINGGDRRGDPDAARLRAGGAGRAAATSGRSWPARPRRFDAEHTRISYTLESLYNAWWCGCARRTAPASTSPGRV